MKNEILNNSGKLIMNGLMNGCKWLANKGVRSVMIIPDTLGNIIKIRTFKNHNMSFYFFMK